MQFLPPLAVKELSGIAARKALEENFRNKKQLEEEREKAVRDAEEAHRRQQEKRNKEIQLQQRLSDLESKRSTNAAEQAALKTAIEGLKQKRDNLELQKKDATKNLEEDKNSLTQTERNLQKRENEYGKLTAKAAEFAKLLRETEQVVAKTQAEAGAKEVYITYLHTIFLGLACGSWTEYCIYH